MPGAGAPGLLQHVHRADLETPANPLQTIPADLQSRSMQLPTNQIKHPLNYTGIEIYHQGVIAIRVLYVESVFEGPGQGGSFEGCGGSWRHHRG